MFQNDYGMHILDGYPKDGQTLDEVQDLMLAELDKVKKGEFEDWMIDAVVNDLKLSQLQQFESSSALASNYYNAFIHRENWSDVIQKMDRMKAVSK